MDKQPVICSDLGFVSYKDAWQLQEKLLQDNVAVKSQARVSHLNSLPGELPTQHHLLFCEHPAVFTLGKNGNRDNVLVSENTLLQKGIQFFHINRGGDITFHGPGQIVGYPIFDLEKMFTDIGKYLRLLEEVIILTIADYGLIGERSPGETGVWLDTRCAGKARKICAIGIRCSRWITMHGFALNVNTDLKYFDYIVPCGITGKGVTSMQRELHREVSLNEVKEKLKFNFEQVFNVQLIAE